MPNETTKAFREMMLSGRLNELMCEAVQEGIAATEAARRAKETEESSEPQNPRPFVRPTHFTPKDKTPRLECTEAELDEQFRIPDHVLKGASKPKD